MLAQGGEHEFLGQPFDGLFIFTFLSPLSLDPVNDQFVCRVMVLDYVTEYFEVFFNSRCVQS